jgi:hypothetical protein
MLVRNQKQYNVDLKNHMQIKTSAPEEGATIH